MIKFDINSDSLTKIPKKQLFALTMKEIFIAIGFSKSEFANWKNPSQNFASYQPEKMTRDVQINNAEILLLTTPKVQNFVRKFYECELLGGAALDGKNGEFWDPRFHRGDFLSYGEKGVSGLSLAALEDSGWYRSVGEAQEEVQLEGLGYGCGLYDSVNPEFREEVEDRQMFLALLDVAVAARTKQDYDTVGKESKDSLESEARAQANVAKRAAFDAEIQFEKAKALEKFNELQQANNKSKLDRVSLRGQLKTALKSLYAGIQDLWDYVLDKSPTKSGPNPPTAQSSFLETLKTLKSRTINLESDAQRTA
jgi:hypothetical protein